MTPFILFSLSAVDTLPLATIFSPVIPYPNPNLQSQILIPNPKFISQYLDIEIPTPNSLSQIQFPIPNSQYHIPITNAHP